MLETIILFIVHCFCCDNFLAATDSLFLLLIHVPVEMDESKSHPGRSTGWVAIRVLDSAALSELIHSAS